ncbi:MAG: stage II sporulation protein SpoIID [Peptococcaceae bacterium BRH_c8a]|nr:MAG: stage II sporulation protein SpoIID [Peptococcaceae bacterium BRH_c8a]
MRKIFLLTLILVLLLIFGLPYVINRSTEPPVREEETLVRLYRHDTDEVEVIPLDDYVTSVVAAEMPAEFHTEALKAQAVAARTYIVKRILAGGVSNTCHPGADTCDNPSHSQAWLPRNVLKERWGALQYYQYYYKVRMAVDDTAGEIITYSGQPIDPVFHSACGGHTENSEDVWKYEVSYLRGVDCPYENVPQPEQSVTMPLDKVEKALGVNLNTVAVAATGGNAEPFQVVERTAAGKPKIVLVDGKNLAAVDVRQKLGLRSTDFKWTINGGQITIKTRGYGHGVGMCQYGAAGMAENGDDYRKILNHYYTGISISKIN